MVHPRTRAPETTRHVRKSPDSGHVVDRPRDLRATRQRLRAKFPRSTRQERLRATKFSYQKDLYSITSSARASEHVQRRAERAPLSETAAFLRVQSSTNYDALSGSPDTGDPDTSGRLPC
jgi:hypothetical protein